MCSVNMSVHVHMCVIACTCAYARMCVHMCVHGCVGVCVVHMCVCVCVVCECMGACVRVYTFVHVCNHAYSQFNTVYTLLNCVSTFNQLCHIYILAHWLTMSMYMIHFIIHRVVVV